VSSFRSRLRLAAIVIATAGLLAATGNRAHATTIQRVVSPGGIEAWLVQDATVPLIAIEYAFKGGSTQDPPGKPGVANMTAGLLDEGAGDLDSRSYHERLERRAIELSFNDSRDYFRGSLRTLKDNRDEAFDLLRMALTQPRFDDEPLGRARNQVLSSLRRQTTDPSSIANRRFFEAAYGQHPYAWPGDGTLASVPTITADEMRAYVKHVLARDTLKIAVVGDIDAATLGTLLDKTFGGLPAHGELTPIAPVTMQATAGRINAALDVPQTVMLFGAPGLQRADPDFMAGYVANHIMAGGALTSRLYREVREKRGLVYSISESLIWMEQSSLLVGSTATRADRTNATISTIEQEVHRMAEDGPTQTELDEAKSFLKGSQMLSLDTSPKIAAALLQFQLDKLGIDYIEKRNSLVDAVSLDDVKRVAKRLWGQPFLTVVVGRVAQPAAN
jgi:zinc protease